MEELSFYHHTAHFGIQFLHGGHFACKGLAHDDVAVTAVLCAVARVDVEPQLTKVVLVHQQLTDGGNQRLRQGLTAADIHLHGAILRIQRAAKHLRIVEGEADLTRRHKALKKIKKWDLITHSS